MKRQMEMILEHLNAQKRRRFAIWGTGKYSDKGIDLMLRLGVGDFFFIDSDDAKQGHMFHGKLVVSPDCLEECNYYVVVATAYDTGISGYLKRKGFHEIDDFIFAGDLEYYEALHAHKDAPFTPYLDYGQLTEIENSIKAEFHYEMIEDFNPALVEGFARELDFGDAYRKGFKGFSHPDVRYRRKLTEYYFAYKMLNLERLSDTDRIYIDVGAQSSPFARWLREKKRVCAYGLDMEENSPLDYYLREDATDMHFSDNSVDALSMQSSFETFLGDADIRFLIEAGRVLKPGGELVISPLYLHKQYLSTVSPDCYGKGHADPGSLECIRTDCRGGLTIGRFHSVDSLRERVIKTAAAAGLEYKIYILPNRYVTIDDFVYLKFILNLTKMR